LKLEDHLTEALCFARKEGTTFAVDKQASEIENGRIKFLREENDLTASQRDPEN